jgi:HPt (histidine-containing phosphotransfer) domain-containing protein
MIDDLWQAYVDSASSLLSELEVAAMEYENGKNIEENAAAIRRILHSIKGESGIIGLMDVYTGLMINTFSRSPEPNYTTLNDNFL